MDLCHLKHSGWQNIYKYTKGESCFLETNVKDDTGCKAVFSEQGASASQVTAAQVSDTISRLSGLVGETNDAVSACTQEKRKHAPRLLKLPATECSTIGMRLPRDRRPAIWRTINAPAVFYESKFQRHPSGV